MGVINVTLPYSELRDILLPNGIIRGIFFQKIKEQL